MKIGLNLSGVGRSYGSKYALELNLEPMMDVADLVLVSSVQHLTTGSFKAVTGSKMPLAVDRYFSSLEEVRRKERKNYLLNNAGCAVESDLIKVQRPTTVGHILQLLHFDSTRELAPIVQSGRLPCFRATVAQQQRP